MATVKRKFRTIAIEVTGTDPNEAMNVMTHAVAIARELAADRHEPRRDAKVTVKGLAAKATITVAQEST